MYKRNPRYSIPKSAGIEVSPRVFLCSYRHGIWYDLWWCNYYTPTIIAKYGDEPGNEIHCYVYYIDDTHHPAIQTGKIRAHKLGLI